MAQIVLSTTSKGLAALRPAFTVEAEYGSTLVCGSCGTLAHHEAAIALGMDSGCPCLLSPDDTLWSAATSELTPSNAPSPFWERPNVISTIGVSHWDWDTAGGVFALLGVKPNHGIWRKVWQSIAYTDVHGPHRAEECRSWTEVRPIVEAMLAYANAHRITAPKEATVVDITPAAWHYCTFLDELDQEVQSIDFSSPLRWREEALLNSGLPLLESGLRFRLERQDLDAQSFLASYAGKRILLRASDRFVNHLYRHEDGVAPCVIGFNTTLGTITLSFEHPDALGGLSASELMRAHFGDRAGGHRSIAGSPRGESYSLTDAETLARFVERHILRYVNKYKDQEK